MSNENNNKPTFISEKLSSSKRYDLFSLIWEFVDAFAWNYENMFGLDM